MNSRKNELPSFDELGGEYRRKFYSRADYLIERGYVSDVDREDLAKKVYAAFVAEKTPETVDKSVDS
jgi:hypothetical protein